MGSLSRYIGAQMWGDSNRGFLVYLFHLQCSDKQNAFEWKPPALCLTWRPGIDYQLALWKHLPKSHILAKEDELELLMFCMINYILPPSSDFWIALAWVLSYFSLLLILFHLPPCHMEIENRRGSVDIFLKAAGYLDCAIRHVLPQLSSELRFNVNYVIE